MQLPELTGASSTTTGNGNFTLSPINGLQTPAAAIGTGSSNTFPYAISNSAAAELEWGVGYMNDSTTLIRQTVLGGSNGTSPVSFSAGTKSVSIDLHAQYQFLVIKPPRVIIAGPTATVLNTDKIIEINQTVGAPITVNLSQSTLNPGQIYYIVDAKGDAGTNNITLTLSSGVFPNTGNANYVMSNDGETVGAYINGTNGGIL